jgi:hypothetical protein
MKKTLEIYCLVVCFFTVACFSITLGLFLYQAIRIALPQITVSAFKERGFDDALSKMPVMQQNALKQTLKVPAGYTYDQMQKMYWGLNYNTSIQVERRDALQLAIKYFIIIVVDLLIFIPHWRIVRSKKRLKEEAS